jgi:Zn-dependent protease with chaperone function
MHNIKKLQFFVGFIFFVSIILFLITPGFDDKWFGGLWGLLGIYYIFKLSLVQLFFNSYRRILGITASRFEYLKLQIGCLCYFTRIPISVPVAFLTIKTLSDFGITSKQLAVWLSCVVIAVLIAFYGLTLAAIILAKKIIGPMIPHKSPDIEFILNDITKIIQTNNKNKNKNIQIKGINLEKFKEHNVFGTSSTITYTQSLEKALSEDEFRAILLHGAAQIKLGLNLTKFILRLVLVLFCSFLILLPISLVLMLFSMMNMPSQNFFDLLFLCQFGLVFLILAWRSRLRIYKADKYAVKLGASPAALSSALAKM